MAMILLLQSKEVIHFEHEIIRFRAPCDGVSVETGGFEREGDCSQAL